jgi:transposase
MGRLLLEPHVKHARLVNKHCAVHDVRRRRYSAEEKIRIVLEVLRGESSIAELCRKEGINQNLYYRWSKEFLEAGKKRLAGDTAREASSDEVKELRSEAARLKEALASLAEESGTTGKLLPARRSESSHW